MPRPVIVSTWSFAARGHDRAWPALERGGPSLDAVETVCRVVEADPEVDSVGYGGLPDRDGEMTLDASIMLGPDRCGAVCALAGFPHPISVARGVMERSPHVLLAGEGAAAFAREAGFEAGPTLADHARSAWEAWKRDGVEPDLSADRGAGARPIDTGGGRLFGSDRAEGEARWRHHDTIGSLAIDSDGVLAGACSTSGTPYKHPGRVGDSPIIGHGLYVDPECGAAVATGAGELVMGVCGAFLAVELMRGGSSPEEALDAVLRRVAGRFRILEEHQVAMIALDRDGASAAAALRPGFRCVVTDATGTRVSGR